jgi:hypothetical protein
MAKYGWAEMIRDDAEEIINVIATVDFANRLHSSFSSFNYGT